MAFGKIGEFSVVATLGAGANSSVLRIRRNADGREYALKMVTIDGPEDQKFLKQAEHEFRVGQMLDHPNLVKVYAIEKEKGLFGFGAVKKVRLLVEYVDGQTLDKVKLMKPAKLLRVLEKIASGMVHMHRRGVFHADMKPNNVMLGRGTTVKVFDYGLAWIKGEPKDRVQGTPEYMAPETASHKLVNERTDIFNFGATMYRLVTLQLPPSVITGLPDVPMTEKTYRSQFRPVNEITPTVQPALCDLIHRCMTFKATNRPETMAEVQGTLDKLADDAAAKLDDPEDLDA